MTATTGTGGPFLDVDLDPEVWLIGPTPERPLDAWLPGAVDVTCEGFGLEADQARERDVVEAVLGGTARQHPSPLPLFAVRWPELLQVPLVLFFGLVEKDQDTGEAWLAHADGTSVEAPLVEDVEAVEPLRIRRSFAYGTDELGALVASVRYLVDAGRTDAWVLAHAGSDQPAHLTLAREDVETLLRSVRVTDRPTS
jgi:hypothetical protein